jgi:hypothetical protein
MPLGSVLLHVGVPLREQPTEEDPEYVEGEPATTEPTEGAEFDCLLIFPRGGDEETPPRGRRTVKRPVILYEPFDVAGADLVLKAEDQVKVTAEELTGPEPVTWQIDGEPTPMAKPGFLVGIEAALKRIDD